MTHHISVGGTSGRGWVNWSANNDGTGAFGTILTPTALDWPTVDHLSLKLDDSHSSVLVSVKLDESEAAVGLHPNFGQIST